MKCHGLGWAILHCVVCLCLYGALAMRSETFDSENLEKDLSAILHAPKQVDAGLFSHSHIHCCKGLERDLVDIDCNRDSCGISNDALIGPDVVHKMALVLHNAQLGRESAKKQTEEHTPSAEESLDWFITYVFLPAWVIFPVICLVCLAVGEYLWSQRRLAANQAPAGVPIALPIG
jgi:hypothetical protein